MDPLHVYIHWPFCKAKCPYCDFNSHVRDNIDNDVWLDSYLREIEFFRDVISSRSIKTIFFGGGTPSLMPPKNIKKIIEKLKSISHFDNIEITLEANPTSSESKKFQDFKAAGVNRVSIGIQSFNDKDLKFLGREHSAIEAIKTLEFASEIFNNYSFDLIYARPRQTLLSWEKELRLALKYAKDHISLYQLGIEKGTRFYSDFRDKKFTLPEQEEAVELYNITQGVLLEKGLCRYEISNYAVPGRESQHNLGYWKYREYLGIGAGAHSKIKYGNDLHHIFMIHNPEKWLSSVSKRASGIQRNERMKHTDVVLEFLLMGLRLEEGVDLEYLHKFFNININDFLSEVGVNSVVAEGLLCLDNKKMQLTDSGKMLLNDIVARITL